MRHQPTDVKPNLRSKRRGFSLVEAVISLSLLSVTAAVLLNASQVAVVSAQQSMDEMVALGIANQLIDEAMGMPYVAKSYTASDPNGVAISNIGSGTDTGARVGGTWDDLDDFNGSTATSTYYAQPPVDSWGAEYGRGNSTISNGVGGLRHANFQIRADFFDSWRIETNVYYLNPIDLTQKLSSGTSKFRCLEARVYRVLPNNSTLLLKQLKRIHAHVPKPYT